MPYSKGVSQQSWVPTRKWFTAAGTLAVALIAEYVISPTPGTPTFEWGPEEWAILGSGVSALFLSYMNRNAATPTADGVPSA